MGLDAAIKFGSQTIIGMQSFFYLFFFLPFLFSTDIAWAQGRIGEKAPGFSTMTLDGQRVALKEYWEKQGKKAVILSFFATWCQPCKADLQYLQQMQTQHGAQGLQVLSVLTQDSPKEADLKAFLQKLAVNLLVLMDQDGIIGKRYGVTGLPCNTMIDQDGILRAKYFGYSEAVKRDFETRLKELLTPP